MGETSGSELLNPFCSLVTFCGSTVICLETRKVCCEENCPYQYKPMERDER